MRLTGFQTFPGRHTLVWFISQPCVTSCINFCLLSPLFPPKTLHGGCYRLKMGIVFHICTLEWEEHFRSACISQCRHSEFHFHSVYSHPRAIREMDKQLRNRGGGAKINKIPSKCDDLELSFISAFFFFPSLCSSRSSDLIKPALCLLQFPVFVASFVCLLNLSSCLLKPRIHVCAGSSETNV